MPKINGMFLTSREVVKKFNVTESKLLRWVKKDLLHPTRLSSGNYIWDGEEIKKIKKLIKEGRKITA